MSYAKEMLAMITTYDTKWDKDHMNMLADQLKSKLNKLGQSAEKEHILRFLEELRLQTITPPSDQPPLTKMPSQKTVIERMYGSFHQMYKAFKIERNATSSLERALLGLEEGAALTLKSGLMSKSSWIMVAFFYLADSGLMYRKYK